MLLSRSAEAPATQRQPLSTAVTGTRTPSWPVYTETTLSAGLVFTYPPPPTRYNHPRPHSSLESRISLIITPQTASATTPLFFTQNARKSRYHSRHQHHYRPHYPSHLGIHDRSRCLCCLSHHEEEK